MKTTISCDSQGNRIRSDRHWNDAWWIMLDMAICLACGLLMLFIDIYDGNDSRDIRKDFGSRLRMVLDEIPLHLRSVNYKENK